MSEHDVMKGTAAFAVMSMAMLVDELDKRGSISKADFEHLLRASAKDARDKQSPKQAASGRFDLTLMERLADNLLTAPRTGNPPMGMR